MNGKFPCSFGLVISNVLGLSVIGYRDWLTTTPVLKSLIGKSKDGRLLFDIGVNYQSLQFCTNLNDMGLTHILSEICEHKRGTTTYCTSKHKIGR